MKLTSNLFYISLLGLVLGGCSIDRYIPQGESLYVGGKVKVESDSTSRRYVANLEGPLEDLLRPAPNKTLFGFPYKVWLHYWIGEPKKEKGFRNWFRRKFGEPPVFATQRIVAANVGVITGYLNNEGYFRSSATGELVEKKKRTVEAHYTAYLKPRYYIDSVTFVVRDSSQFSKDLLSTQRRTRFKTGDPYRFEVVREERQRIDRILKTRGYYYFNPDYLIIKIDSTHSNNTVNLFVELKLTAPQTAIKQYYINDVYVYANYNGLSNDTLSGQVDLQGGLHILDPERNYRPRIFDDAIGFRQGLRYSSAVHDVSLSRLVNLQNFKFVKNRFELIPRSDSAFLDVYYYLTPLRKKALRAELSGVTKSNDLAGSQISLSWTNRNLFRGAEILRLSSNAGIDFQVGGRAGNDSLRNNNFLRLNLQGELSFPRFVIPFYKPDPATGQALPKTTLTLAYETLTQQGFYTQTSMRGQWGYTWRRNTEVEQTFMPLGVNVIRTRNVSNQLVERIFAFETSDQDRLRFLRLLDSRLILETQYNIIYRPRTRLSRRHQFYLSGGINTAGNLAGLLAKNRRGEENDGQLFGVFYEQFARFDGELRYYFDISPRIRWANRFQGGLGIPYGNSYALPQFKQYFAGGSIGLRAFRARTVGPGAYYADSTTRSLLGDNSFGDIKLEFNTEFRIKFTSLINGAIFADAGNIWNYRLTELYGPEAVFGPDFYTQIAAGGGLGIRFDLNFLVFRVDLATPFRKPWYTLEEGRNPWVFNEFNLRSKEWRQQNLVLNIAVAYPF
ncbi:BamA/TamA family outer membrane protein [Rhabdobacter roseus]|uniref:Outer membrane translocation and assembly module TamA n=1 Tax=Rhabdobacter roseus TaxID=1655419 RepID=A0A840TP33_9BACT|nr:BamA/TamA family outer membrane protein [Rhabdobacter roseus]MBB5285114.1 outer membrane translocation and assembly module TamA [Rhabdobacter roseus]